MPKQRLKQALDFVRLATPLIKQSLSVASTFTKETGHRQARVDVAVNELLLNLVQTHFPEDGTITEEDGSCGADSEYLWMIDPVDGTSNLTVGIPYAGTAIALFHKKELVWSVVYQPFADQLFVAECGGGATCNGIPLKPQAISNEKVGYYIQGYGVPKESHLRILQEFLPCSDRILKTWAPALDWCNLAHGLAGFLIALETEIEDAVQGILMMQEAGGNVTDWNNQPLQIPITRGARITLAASFGSRHEKLCEKLRQIPSNELPSVDRGHK